MYRQPAGSPVTFDLQSLTRNHSTAELSAFPSAVSDSRVRPPAVCVFTVSVKSGAVCVCVYVCLWVCQTVISFK